MNIGILEMFCIEKYFSIQNILKISDIYMFYPYKNQICISNYNSTSNSEYYSRIKERVTSILTKNNIEVTDQNIDLFCILHEIGHYFDCKNYKIEDFLKSRKIEEVADNFAIKHFNKIKEVLENVKSL